MFPIVYAVQVHAVQVHDSLSSFAADAKYARPPPGGRVTPEKGEGPSLRAPLPAADRAFWRVRTDTTDVELTSSRSR